MASLTALTQSRSFSRGLTASWSLEAAPSHAGLYLQLHGLFNSTDTVQVI